MLPNFYSECATLVVGCRLYSDAQMTTPVPDSFYSNGVNCYTVVNGSITIVSDCSVPCDIAIGHITSTDPTTLGGSDGTITVNFTGTHGPFTYSLNGTPVGPAVTPLVVTGLSSNTPYTIAITDFNNCSVNSTVTLGQSATLFDADYIMITYQFTNGLDLDTRTRVAIPNIGQDTQPEYLGWSCLTKFPVTGIPVLSWGGDNTGTGFESVLINISQFKITYPSVTSFTLDLRAYWYSSIGTNPVVVGVTLWKGGTPVNNGCSGYCWTNPTALYTGTINSVPTTITLYPPHSGPSPGNTSGQRVATLKYDLTSFVSVLNNADTTTPSV